MARRSATVISRGKGRNKTWWARLNYVDEATGKRRDRQRRARSYADAKELAEAPAKEFDESAGRSIDAERMTFAELADYCEKHYYKAALYHEGRKVAGVRGLATAKGQIKALTGSISARSACAASATRTSATSAPPGSRPSPSAPTGTSPSPRSTANSRPCAGC